MKRRKQQINKKTEKRKPVAPGSKKNEPGLKAQYSRTAMLNALAGSINKAVRAYAPRIRPSDYYHRLLRIFRNAGVEPRLLLLWRLRDMEVNPSYDIYRLVPFLPALTVEKKRGHINAALEMKGHVYATGEKVDSYYLHLLVCLWDKTAAVPVVVSKMTEWILLEEGIPAYEIDLGRHTGATEYLAFVRIVRGWESVDAEMLSMQGMKVFAAGSFTKAGMALIERHVASLKPRPVVAAPKNDPPVERVKPVRVTPLKGQAG